MYETLSEYAHGSMLMTQEQPRSLELVINNERRSSHSCPEIGILSLYERCAKGTYRFQEFIIGLKFFHGHERCIWRSGEGKAKEACLQESMDVYEKRLRSLREGSLQVYRDNIAGNDTFELKEMPLTTPLDAPALTRAA
jgi:hypothetical protein